MTSEIIDAHGARNDPDMRCLAAALDADRARTALHTALRSTAPEYNDATLTRIEVLRWKPSRRCVVAYTLTPTDGDAVTVLAKMRAKGLDYRTATLHEWLWRHDFAPARSGGIAVARPLGVIQEFGATLQRLEPGVSATELIAHGSRADARLAARASADTLARLHRCGAPIARVHRIVDEVEVLRARLFETAQHCPDHGSRVRRVLEACERRAARLAPPRGLVPVHRDFYADHVLVATGQRTLIDLDLCSLGDPWMDVGNYIGHLTELAMRTTTSATAYEAAEQAFVERSLELSPVESRAGDAIDTYVTLTLARHIDLSTRLPGRGHITASLIDRCEERLGLGGRPRRSANVTRAITAAAVCGLLAFAAPRATGAQAPNASRVTVEMRQYGVYDSNIDRELIPVADFGGVLGAAFRVVDRPVRPRFNAGFEVGLHRFSQTNVWDRTSLAADAAFELRPVRWLILESSGMGSLKGSNEDRELGDQLHLEQLVRVRLPFRVELRGAGAHRLRRYDDTTRDATNQYAEAELRVRFGGMGRLDLGIREERNNAPVPRVVYRRKTATVDLVLNVGRHDVFGLEVKGQRKHYPFRLTEIEVDDAPDLDVPRVDRRLQPEFTWEHTFGTRANARVEYEFDWRTSNDVEKRYTGHRVTLALSQRLW